MFHANSSRTSKALIAIGLLTGLFVGCYGHLNAKEIAQIESRGGKVEFDPADNAVAEAWLTSDAVDDSDLECVAWLLRLRAIFVDRSQVSDDGLKSLAGLPVLLTLRLFDTQIGDAGLASIADLKMPTRSGLGNTKVTDAGLPALRPFAQLHELNLGGTQVTDSGMAALAPMTQLHKPDLFDIDSHRAPGEPENGCSPPVLFPTHYHSRDRQRWHVGSDRPALPYCVADRL